MKPLKNFLAWALAASMVFQGCARFEPTPMPVADPQDFPYGLVKDGIEVRIAPFSAQEVETYFASKLTRKNVWPMRVGIENESRKTYLFSKGFAGPHRISSHEAAREGRRKAGWRLAWGLIFFATFFGIPIAIPLFVTGCQALGANSYMESEYRNWEIPDRELGPGDSVSGILFFQSPNVPAQVQISLLDPETEEHLGLTVDLSEPFKKKEKAPAPASDAKLMQAVEHAKAAAPGIEPPVQDQQAPVPGAIGTTAAANTPLPEKQAA